MVEFDESSPRMRGVPPHSTAVPPCRPFQLRLSSLAQRGTDGIRLTEKVPDSIMTVVDSC